MACASLLSASFAMADPGLYLGLGAREEDSAVIITIDGHCSGEFAEGADVCHDSARGAMLYMGGYVARGGGVAVAIEGGIVGARGFDLGFSDRNRTVYTDFGALYGAAVLRFYDTVNLLAGVAQWDRELDYGLGKFDGTDLIYGVEVGDDTGIFIRYMVIDGADAEGLFIGIRRGF